MVCLSRVLTISCTVKPSPPYKPPSLSSRFVHTKCELKSRWRSMATEPDSSSSAQSDFAKMELQEIEDNIRSRRNKIFLQMEEVRRLRIQQRIKSAELGIFKEEQESELPNFPSFIPFLPPLTSANLKVYYVTCYSLIAGIIIFGGLLAPTLELKLGLGGTSYADFIRSVHLPMQLSQVDPIVASFSGGAVGVISALMVVEINNVKQQEHKRCKYCLGT
ncbi:hypothetical protein Godav_017010, partial [Gossypium davidsonii]|nr:hypothetical protein [Gossypium davidsonii]